LTEPGTFWFDSFWRNSINQKKTSKKQDLRSFFAFLPDLYDPKLIIIELLVRKSIKILKAWLVFLAYEIFFIKKWRKEHMNKDFFLRQIIRCRSIGCRVSKTLASSKPTEMPSQSQKELFIQFFLDPSTHVKPLKRALILCKEESFAISTFGTGWLGQSPKFSKGFKILIE